MVIPAVARLAAAGLCRAPSIAWFPSSRQRRLIVVYAITCAQNRALSFAKCPGETNARREVVFVRRKPAARDAIRANRHETPRCDVVDTCTIFSINRRRVVFVPQAGSER